jgi:hypothetical protein
MTADNSTSLEEAEIMRAEVFEIAASQVSFHGARLETPRIVQAARAVLVDGKRTGEAAAAYDFPPERVSEAVGRIRDKWNAICEERGWITETFSLTPNLISLLKLIEMDSIGPLQTELGNKRKKKAAKEKSPELLKVAEKKPRSYKSATDKTNSDKPGSDKKKAPKK